MNAPAYAHKHNLTKALAPPINFLNRISDFASVHELLTNRSTHNDILANSWN
jgi:hypothetical protein